MIRSGAFRIMAYLLVAGGGTIIGFVIGGAPGAVVGFGISVVGIASNY